MKFRDELISMDACDDAVTWVGNKSRKRAWEKCNNSQWMLWLINKERLLDDSALRLLACDFAEDVLPIFEKKYPNDDRPRKTIALARRFAVGKATREELAAAWAAARDAAGAAARDAMMEKIIIHGLSLLEKK